MRIAFITESFPKLSETFILGKVVMLAQLGHEVTVFTQFRRPPVHSDLLRQINLDRNVVHLPVWDRVRFRDVTRAIAGAGPHPLRMAGVAGAALSGPGARMLALVKSLPFVRQRFDLIHAHYAYMGLRYLDVARTLKLPLIVSLLGKDTSVQMARDPAAYQPLFATAARLVVVVDYLKDVAVASGCDPAKLTLIPNEVDTGFFQPVTRIRSGPPVILTVGRLHWAKGLLYGLSAMAALKAEGLDFRYRMVGAGDERAALTLCIRDLALEDRVELVGPLDREGVRSELEAADVFFLPSVIEEFGVVLIEAQATGLPVVATRVGGVPEALRDGETGLLVPSRDPAAMAGALRRLLNNPAERQAMGGRGAVFVREHFDAGRLMARLVALYEETVRDARRQG